MLTSGDVWRRGRRGCLRRRRGRGEGGRRRRRTAYIKSNNPHLTGGEQRTGLQRSNKCLQISKSYRVSHQKMLQRQVHNHGRAASSARFRKTHAEHIRYIKIQMYQNIKNRVYNLPAFLNTQCNQNIGSSSVEAPIICGPLPLTPESEKNCALIPYL